jgi:hypothetical protein
MLRAEIEAALDGGANFGDHADDWQGYPFRQPLAAADVENREQRQGSPPSGRRRHPKPANSGRAFVQPAP